MYKLKERVKNFLKGLTQKQLVALALGVTGAIGAGTVVSFFYRNIYKKYLVCRLKVAPHHAKEIPRATPFDYVIIGGGAGGCVLAARLSENPKMNVLLLEAGHSDANLEAKVPIAFPQMFKKEHDWNYESQPEASLDGKCMYSPRGKLLGGSTNMNAHIYNRGHPEDYNEWANITGDDSWRYEEVLKYFKKSEKQTNPQMDQQYHGSKGELYVTDQMEPHNMTHFLIESQDVGFNPDSNAGYKQEGVGLVQRMTKYGERCSAADAFLNERVLKRKNLVVKTNALVSRLSFSSDKKIEAVHYVAHGIPNKVLVRSEAILCAGAFNTPHVLMLSGVGPKKELEKHGIPVVAHIPGIGQNLQDHIMAGIGYETDHESLCTKENVWNLLQWLYNQTGPYVSNVVEAVGFFKSNEAEERPNIEALIAPAYYRDNGFKKITDRNCFGAATVLLRPYSRGYLTLRSNKPTDPIDIHFNFLSDSRDRQALIDGFKRVRSWFQRDPIAAYCKKELLPGDDVQTDEQLLAYLKEELMTVYHPSCTCRMGSLDDEMTVVDSNGLLREVSGVRIVDASIMPNVVAGHTTAPVYMMAEKIADVIKAFW